MEKEKELFRKESLEHKKIAALGAVHLASPITHTAWTIAALCAAVGTVFWLTLVHYTRRVRVDGLLVPSTGLITLSARHAGAVQEVLVHEGQLVASGDPLVVIAGERASQALGDTNASISASIKEQQSRLNENIASAFRSERLARQSLLGQLRMLEGQQRQVKAQLASTTAEKESFEEILLKIRPLGLKGYVSAVQIQQQEVQVLTIQTQLDGLTRQGFEIGERIESLTGQLNQLPITFEAQSSALKQQLLQSDQELAKNEVDRASILRARAPLIVSTLLVKPGESVATNQSIISLRNIDSRLQAQFFVPSSAIGFIHKKTRVAFRYAAYPYQKFGLAWGRVSEISDNALNPSQIAEIMGRSTAPEHMYRVEVTLDEQTIDVNGATLQLRAGSAVSADLMVDRRSMLEWFFDPVYGFQSSDLGDPG